MITSFYEIDLDGSYMQSSPIVLAFIGAAVFHLIFLPVLWYSFGYASDNFVRRLRLQAFRNVLRQDVEYFVGDHSARYVLYIYDETLLRLVVTIGPVVYNLPKVYMGSQHLYTIKVHNN